MSPFSSINLLQGTDSTRDFSTGNTLPIAAHPWGLHHWSLQTAEAPWLFNPRHPKLQGIRLTHQPSPWMGDYGSVTIYAFADEGVDGLVSAASAWKVADAFLSPARLQVELLRYGITVEMAPSPAGAVFRFSFNRSNGSGRPGIGVAFEGGHELSRETGAIEFVGVSRNHRGGVPENFGMHFVGDFDACPEEFSPNADGGCWRFAEDTEVLEMRIAGSFIGSGQARIALNREVGDRSLEEIEDECTGVWSGLLSRVELSADDDERAVIFYSCLYRCLLFPRLLDEVNENGEVVHYSPYDGKIYPGPLCTDNGFWDTYRTVYPLLALVFPDKLPHLMQGWLNACREAGGWSPKWASPALQDCMIGTHFDAVVADLAAKEIPGWDLEEAFQSLLKNASDLTGTGFAGRPGLEDFIQLGYMPCDKYSHSVSATLDYAYGDFCVAQVAARLGKTGLVSELMERSQNYRNVFDASTGFMRARRADGSWNTPFSEFRWGDAYIEGGPWQHSFHVPHDPAGLAALHGGNDALCRKLDGMMESQPHFERGNYPTEIHEMTEMAMADFGQYAQSNQPVHGYLFLYALCGEPEKTSFHVRRVAEELYGPDRFPGDEDNGEMAAWYLFACFGLYPYCPGLPEYVCFEPALKGSVKIHCPDDKEPLLLGRAFYEKWKSDCRPVTVKHRDLQP